MKNSVPSTKKVSTRFVLHALAVTLLFTVVAGLLNGTAADGVSNSLMVIVAMIAFSLGFIILWKNHAGPRLKGVFTVITKVSLYFIRKVSNWYLKNIA